MDNLFEIVFDTFYLVWQNITYLFSPIINFITGAIQWLMPFLTSLVQWILNAIEAIVNWFSNLFGINGWGGDGGFGGAGGGGTRPIMDMLLMAKEMVTQWTIL